MRKAEKRFVLYAAVAILVLLGVLLGIINGANFTMAAQDADRLTEEIAASEGSFGQGQEDQGSQPGQGGEPGQSGQQSQQGQTGQSVQNGFDPFSQHMGPMGPNSPDTRSSVRYFTAAFDEDGNGTMIFYNISAVTEEEAVSWAEELRGGTTGWTNGTYRYRVYEKDGLTYVTVIDQGRELLPSYRILVFSVFGTVLGVIISYLVLRLVGRKLFYPLEEADRKQKQFIAGAEREFRMPLTVISADAEIMERREGPTDESASIRRQVRKLDSLVDRLGAFAVFEEEDMTKVTFCLSDVMNECLDKAEDSFAERGIKLTREIADGAMLTGDPQAVRQVVTELIDNARKYSKSGAAFSLTAGSERTTIKVSNDTDLPDGGCDQVFDRFIVMENAPEGSTGLGLSYVKDVVRAHNGRTSARVASGVFELEIDL